MLLPLLYGMCRVLAVVDCCLLFWCLLSIVRWLLAVARYSLSVACCVLVIGCCFWSVGCRVLFDGWCVLFVAVSCYVVVRCALLGCWCLPRSVCCVVCWLLFVAGVCDVGLL